MNPPDTIALLRQKVQDDPSLQARLSAMDDARGFIAAVSRLAEEVGCPVGEEELRNTMQAGRRAWLERNVP